MTVLSLGINYYWYHSCTDFNFKITFTSCMSEGSGLLTVTLQLAYKKNLSLLSTRENTLQLPRITELPKLHCITEQ